MSDQDKPRRAGDARRFAGVTDLISEATRIRSLGIHGIESVDPQIERRTRASAWAPTTDILAIGDDLVIRIELPGVDPATIDLRLTRGILTVSGSREDAQAPDAAAFLVRERYLGEFRRSLTLPEGTTPSQISAEFANGLVELTVRGGASGATGSRIPLVERTGSTSTTRPVTDGDAAG